MAAERLSAGQLGSHWASYLCALMWLHVRDLITVSVWGSWHKHHRGLPPTLRLPHVACLPRCVCSGMHGASVQLPKHTDSAHTHLYVLLFFKMINDKPLSCSKTNSFGLSEQPAELVRHPLRSACTFFQAEPTFELGAGSNPFRLQSSSRECDVT